jgi:hypothetical protein
MRVVAVKRALRCLTKSYCRPSLVSGAHSFLSQLISTAHRCRPCGDVGDALASSTRSGKSTGCLLPSTPPVAENAFSDRDCRTTMTVSLRCVAIRGSSPFIDCGFDGRRTSHPVAVPRNGWHHNPSFWRSSGSGGRVHTVCRHITATVCDGPPARIQRG